jgi:N-acetylglucosaminyldiphosphoundecaprenol N-acetyl-beta-D-mannosaminyltransferase
MTASTAGPICTEITVKILGVRVDAVQIPDVIAQMEEWIRERNTCRYIAVTGMHGVTEAQHDARFKTILNSAALVVPDGMPLVWLSRLRGRGLKRRVYGPELMLRFCEETVRRGYRHFLYGGAAGVPEKLAETLASRFPGVEVAGTYSPPFRPLTEEEDAQIVASIRQAAPDVLWVGLSTPKQERWMHEHRERLNVPVLVGVGAAFDINSGRIRQAPRWMREHGLEWLFRLLQEPRRLWRRYLLGGSQFLFYVGLELLGLKKFDSEESLRTAHEQERYPDTHETTSDSGHRE